MRALSRNRYDTMLARLRSWTGRRGRATEEGDLAEIAKPVAADWAHQGYYDEAEPAMLIQWEGLIWPLISGCDFRVVLDLAAGHGRNTQQLLAVAGRVIAVDVNATNVAFMRERFRGIAPERLRIVQNDGARLDMIADGELTFFYCFDAMVHFDSDIVRAYIREAARTLRPGGRGFVHYSNNTSNPTGSYREHRGWRNFMSRELFEHWLAKEGLAVIRSDYLAGVGALVPKGTEDADCLTMFEKPR